VFAHEGISTQAFIDDAIALATRALQP